MLTADWTFHANYLGEKLFIAQAERFELPSAGFGDRNVPITLHPHISSHTAFRYVFLFPLTARLILLRIDSS